MIHNELQYTRRGTIMITQKRVSLMQSTPAHGSLNRGAAASNHLNVQNVRRGSLPPTGTVPKLSKFYKNKQAEPRKRHSSQINPQVYREEDRKDYSYTHSLRYKTHELQSDDKKILRDTTYQHSEI